ncbi:YusW family protein [Sporosarcina beigongshangi]|uniref:YusW family protein n=1 Tax=Sporosarcina beigongshangi TaxID=2782538 RepID=UPI00193A82CD|nr:YusW family protein [Sporosarcina beigongshangi]
MHKLTVLGATILLGALILGGCGNFGKNADKPNREDATIIHEDEKAGGSLETGDGYGFTSFDLDIEVDGKDAIETEYKIDKKLDVNYENKLTNTKLTDSKAMNEIDKLFMHILITKDTPPQEVIDKILKWYQLDSYSKFDLEVDFDDGTRLDIEEIQ